MRSFAMNHALSMSTTCERSDTGTEETVISLIATPSSGGPVVSLPLLNALNTLPSARWVSPGVARACYEKRRIVLAGLCRGMNRSGIPGDSIS